VDNSGVPAHKMLKEANAWARAYLEIAVTNIWSERIIGQLQAYIQKGDQEFRDSVFFAGELEEDQRRRVGGTDLIAIDKAATDMSRSRIFIQYDKHHWKAIPLFEYLEFDNGLISGKFNIACKPYLLGETDKGIQEQFALRSRPEFNMLRKTGAQALYKYFNSWQKTDNHCDITVKELHNLLHTWNNPSYQEFKEFNRTIIKPALEELNEKCIILKHIKMEILDYERSKKAKGTRGKAKTIRFTFHTRTVEMALAQQAKKTKKLAQQAKKRLNDKAKEPSIVDSEFKQIGNIFNSMTEQKTAD